MLHNPQIVPPFHAEYLRTDGWEARSLVHVRADRLRRSPHGAREVRGRGLGLGDGEGRGERRGSLSLKTREQLYPRVHLGSLRSGNALDAPSPFLFIHHHHHR